MKAIAGCFFYFIGMLSLNSCVAQEKIVPISVHIENVYKESSKIRIYFINNSNSIFRLSKYVFCDGGVIFQDLFQVGLEGGAKYDRAYYGGAVDFFDSGQLSKDMFLLIRPKDKLSCEIDISRYYFSYESREFQVFYNIKNPSVGNQKEFKLVSNKIYVILSAAKPVKSKAFH